jgi:hypothetical protein
LNPRIAPTERIHEIGSQNAIVSKYHPFIENTVYAVGWLARKLCGIVYCIVLDNPAPKQAVLAGLVNFKVHAKQTRIESIVDRCREPKTHRVYPIDSGIIRRGILSKMLHDC